LNKKLIYVDYASKGNSGLYSANFLAPICQSYDITMFVHSDFRSQLSGVQKFRIFSRFESVFNAKPFFYIYKYIDLYFCFFCILMKCKYLSRRGELIFWVQFHQSFHAYDWFFSRLKKIGKLIVTVHDAVELAHRYPRFIMSDRDLILSHADVLVVHGFDSINHLKYLGKPISLAPFPLMSECSDMCEIVSHRSPLIKFLFIGHLRKEKGVDRLVNAWRKIPPHILESAILTIVGSISNKDDFNLSGLSNCEFNPQYVSDVEFTEYIKNCDYVVFPYIGGTNSGVFSVASALGKPCLTSSLPIFSESFFFDKTLSFNTVEELTDLICRLIIDHDHIYSFYVDKVKFRVSEYNKVYSDAVRDVVKKLLA
jgi:glycosyltransferase involved in cell wall biosynthesis